MIFNLTPKAIFKANLWLILILLLAHLFAEVAERHGEVRYLNTFVGLVDFNLERNIPTLYSSIALIVSSCLLALIAAANAKVNLTYIPWAVLALIFFFMAVDETASIHERLTSVTRDKLGANAAFLHYAWVVPYGAALIVFVLAYAQFLLRLPRNIMYLFIIAGAAFACGALGFEVLGGNQHLTNGTDNALYFFFYTCEEVLEMLGIAIFIYALLTYIVQEFEGLDLTLDRG